MTKSTKPEELLQELAAELAEIKAWKLRQEQAQADRLVEMRNSVIGLFTSRAATVSEMLTVTEMIRQEATSGFVTAQRSKALQATQTANIPDEIKPTKEYPAKIPQ